ncbi:LysM domain-containing protein [Arthrobacter sp. StoSoilB5]|uniref:LysM peptidoglycan-binding domain-containing protein n=1 Tax=Arthrobacter sp. StoSoilB5 TaxID=2830992 RepID=UPI001CC53610|nr:LysM domain-containing protein [Arthrobacter sp. StoSoilB5]BCW46711.1 hypothetical protein StoSoilB5_38950 [Arthrobacter sp. StoSoilB5]
MNIYNDELQTTLSKSAPGGTLLLGSRKNKFLMIAIAIIVVIGLILLIFGVFSQANNPAVDVGQNVSSEQLTAPQAPDSSPATSAASEAAAAPATETKVPAVEPAVAAAPPAEPAPAEPAPPAVDSNLYTVVAGDTVGSIAARFGVNMNEMLAANGLSGYSVIVPGQVLKLTGPAVPLIDPAPAPAAPAQAAPAQAAPAQAAAPVAAGWTIYVAGSGGQSLVDACIGPIHFTPTDGYALFITEHDFCGGWARFSGIGVGQTVNIPGYGTYTVTGRGQVPNPGTTNNVAAVFGGFPAVVLQTCIPGTSQMLVIGLN